MIRRVAIARFVSPLQHLHPLAPENFGDGDAEDDEVDTEIYYAAEMNGDHYDLGCVATCDLSRLCIFCIKFMLPNMMMLRVMMLEKEDACYEFKGRVSQFSFLFLQLVKVTMHIKPLRVQLLPIYDDNLT